jgi:hypothetical protein
MMNGLEDLTRRANEIGRILAAYARPESEIAERYYREDERGREAMFMALLSRLLLERSLSRRASR